MRRFLLLYWAFFAVIVGLLGTAAFGLLLVDFLFPGTFKAWYIFRGGMPLNLVLLLIFGVQHSVMARQGFKQRLAVLVPPELERSTYVLFSGFVLFWVSALWSPSAPPLYDLLGTVWGYLLLAGAGLGLLVILLALRGGRGLDLAGVSAFWAIYKGENVEAERPFLIAGLHRFVRHPLYLGMLLLFWCTPAMTHDHLFFAEVMTAYLLIGMHFEERDLVARYGEAYRTYQQNVPMLFPFRFRSRR